MSREEHQKVVEFLGTCGFDDVWLVGSEFGAVESPFRKFADIDEVKAAIKTMPPKDKFILIKGSNSTKLFELPALL